MSSYSPGDLANRNNVEGQSKLSRNLGWRTGRGRVEFTATSGVAIGATTLALTLPKGCTVTRCVYKVLTTFASATSAATIALSVVGANDIISAVAINNGTPWTATALPIVTSVTPTISTWLTTTVDSPVTATVAVEALTAGKLIMFLEWLYWGDLALT